MKILIACELSGAAGEAFQRRGHDVTTCDVAPSESSLVNHYQGDVREILHEPWDMIIAFPPCQYLTCCGNKWFNPKFAGRFPGREKKRAQAAEFFMVFVNHPCERVCIENPVGYMNRRADMPLQVVNHTWFGSRFSKRTCLWLRGLPPLFATRRMVPVYRQLKNGRLMTPIIFDTANLKPEERRRERSRLPQGFADAMALQWG